MPNRDSVVCCYLLTEVSMVSSTSLEVLSEHRALDHCFANGSEGVDFFDLQLPASSLNGWHVRLRRGCSASVQRNFTTWRSSTSSSCIFDFVSSWMVHSTFAKLLFGYVVSHVFTVVETWLNRLH